MIPRSSAIPHLHPSDGVPNKNIVNIGGKGYLPSAHKIPFNKFRASALRITGFDMRDRLVIFFSIRNLPKKGKTGILKQCITVKNIDIRGNYGYRR